MSHRVSDQLPGAPAERPDPEAGVVAVITALIAVVLLTFTAMAIDVARWYVEGERLQRTVDAAALAGAPYLPGNLDKAREEARKLIARNGFDSTAVPDSDIVVGDRPSRLKVTMSSTIPNTFAQVIGFGTQTLTRTATADFAAGATMGSYCNMLGNSGGDHSSACPSGEPNFWLNIAGPDNPKVNGDRYATRRCDGGESNCLGTTNLDYFGGGGEQQLGYYVYRITPREAGTLNVEIFDPMFVVVGSRCDQNLAPGPWPGSDAPNRWVSDATSRYQGGASSSYCTGEVSNSSGTPAEQAADAAKLNTTFSVFGPTDTLDPLKAPAIPGCTKSYGGFSGDLTKALVSGDPAYRDDVAENFRRWVGLCDLNVSSAQVDRDFYLIVRTNVPADPSAERMQNPAEDPGTGGNGQNRYSLRVEASGGASDDSVSVSAMDRMPIYANLRSGTTDFLLARVTAANAGAVLTVAFFDVGDGSGPWGASVAIGDTAGGPPAGCRATGEVAGAGYSRPGDLDVGACMVDNVTARDYGGKIQRIEVPIPDTYTCDDTDVTKCWYYLRITYPPGSPVNDSMTWSASLSGDPVRLVR